MHGEDDDVCTDCIENDGLCKKHGRGVLPALAQPAWYRLVGKTHYDKRAEAEKEVSPAALKVRRRKERKRARVLRELWREGVI